MCSIRTSEGLNGDDKKRALRAKIEERGCLVFCIQETKIESFDTSAMKKIAPKRFSKFSFVPSSGASGGLLMGWNDSELQGEVIWCQDFAITVHFSSRHTDQRWKLTTVYGPCHGERRDRFVRWLLDLQIDMEEDWMFVGDFNFYRSSEDRNRGRGNYIDMEVFNSIISHHGLLKIPLKGRSFTWSNIARKPSLGATGLVLHHLGMDSLLPQHSPPPNGKDPIRSYSLLRADRDFHSEGTDFQSGKSLVQSSWFHGAVEQIWNAHVKTTKQACLSSLLAMMKSIWLQC
jgi:hypothetical protein